MRSLSVPVIGVLMIVAAAAGAAHGQVRISQVYGGGNAVGGTYTTDYVELINIGSSAVALTGMAVQTSSQTTASATWHKIDLSGVLQPGQFYLVRAFLPPASPSGIPIPAHDASSTSTSPTLNVSSTFGAVALVGSSQPQFANGCPLPNANILDYVRYHDPTSAAATTCLEAGLAGPVAGDFQRAVFRKNGGCTDTGDCSTDLEVKVANPRNSSVNGFVDSTFAPSRVNNVVGGPVTLTVSRASLGCNFLGVLTSATANLGALGGSATQAMTPAGGGVFTFTIGAPTGLAVGTISIPVTASDGVNPVSTTAFLEVTEPAPPNDTCATAFDLGPSGSFAGPVDNRGAGNDVGTGSCAAGLGTTAGVWFTYLPAVNEVITLSETGAQSVKWGVFTGTCGLLTNVGCSNSEGNETGTVGPQARFRLLGGTRYYFLVGHELGYTPPSPMSVVISSTAAPAPPLNETCASATPVGAFPATLSVDGQGALDDPEFPSCVTQFTGGMSARHGVWYTFTITGNGRLRLTGSAANPISFAVYAGSCGSLAEIGCGTNGSPSSPLGIDIAAAGTYYLQIYKNNSGLAPFGNYDATLDYQLRPPNDQCINAQIVLPASLPIQFTQPIVAALDDADVTCNSSGDATLGRAVWFSFTAPQNGVLSFNLLPSTFTQAMAWYTACAGVQVGCTTSTSAVVPMSAALGAGETLYVAVGESLRSSSDQNGSVMVNFGTFVPAATNLGCAAAFNLNSVSLPHTGYYSAQNASTIAAPFSSCRPMNPGRKALYFRYTSAIHGVMTVNELASVNFSYYRVLRQVGPDPCNSPGDLLEHACSSASPYRIVFNIDPGQTYHIIVADATPNGSADLQPHQLVFDVTPSTAPNDSCTTAKSISSSTFPYHESFADVRPFQHADDVSCNSSGAERLWHGLWYSYTPPADGAITVAEVSASNSVSAVYDLCDMPMISCNPNDDAGYVEVNAAQNYKFVVGYDSSTAGFATAVPMDIYFYRHPRTTHDACENARGLFGFPYSELINIDPASIDGPDFNQTAPCTSASTRIGMLDSVWYKVVATGAGDLTGTINYDLTGNKLGAWAIFPAGAGGSCPNTATGTAAMNFAVPLACGLDGTNAPATLNVALTAGTYYLKVGRSGQASANPGNLVQVDLAFSGAVQGGACCAFGACTMVQNSGACGSGTFQGDGTSCSPNPCPLGVCCRGATCNASISQAACVGSGTAGGLFTLASGVCNVPGNSTTPCCYSDYNKIGSVSVADIFAFLSDWFAASPLAVVGGDGTGTPSVSHIFAFLSAWFAGGC